MAKYTDEQFIAGLLRYGSIRATAAAMKAGESTIYARMKDGQFKEKYLQARADLLRDAVQEMNGKRQAAIDVIVEIMEDKEANPATRLQAAQTLLNTSAKYGQQLQDAEKAVNMQEIKNTPFSDMF